MEGLLRAAGGRIQPPPAELVSALKVRPPPAPPAPRPPRPHRARGEGGILRSARLLQRAAPAAPCPDWRPAGAPRSPAARSALSRALGRSRCGRAARAGALAPRGGRARAARLPARLEEPIPHFLTTARERARRRAWRTPTPTWSRARWALLANWRPRPGLPGTAPGGRCWRPRCSAWPIRRSRRAPWHFSSLLLPCEACLGAAAARARAATRKSCVLRRGRALS